MDRQDETALLLRNAGYKLTPQRLMIVKAMRDAEGHVSASDIAARVHEQFPSVDLSTIYRTLEMLKQIGLVTATDLGEGDILFEWAGSEPHHHLVCTNCHHKVVIAHEYLEPLGERLREEFGFTPALDHFAIFGVCRECAAACAKDSHGHPA